MADLMQKLEVEKSRWLVSGSLKEDLPSLPVDMSALSTLRSLIGTRHCWTGASTHDGEETILADAHKAIREKTGLDSLLILVPRHPERGDHIAESLRQKGWSVALRSRQEAPDQNVQIYIADTLGEMGIWYRLCPVSFIGGALSPIGGHNPYEPALLESAIIHGPHVFNFSEIYQRLHLAGGCLQAATPQGIAIAVVDLLDDEYRKSVIQNAAQALKQDGSATETTLRAILNLID
ncbi:hypothetical protein SAMN06265173_1491 [Thalassovita litoralis]|uniref:3-deoxy-D-manno-octulosonic acid transferase n=2 Tax=Thalassovita litoralis TaxID=1010611 RepID=A0A521FS50_9RHOB|nr:hypothetical protein SAMN06265173_1491 [Thalassovita litoralis]